jgi:hypothetical protein
VFAGFGVALFNSCCVFVLGPSVVGFGPRFRFGVVVFFLWFLRWFNSGFYCLLVWFCGVTDMVSPCACWCLVEEVFLVDCDCDRLAMEEMRGVVVCVRFEMVVV